MLSHWARLYLKRARTGQVLGRAPIPVGCLKRGNHVVVEGEPYPYHYGRRLFTRGFPNPRRYYDARGHYPGYCGRFRNASRSLGSKGVPEHYKVSCLPCARTTRADEGLACTNRLALSFHSTLAPLLTLVGTLEEGEGRRVRQVRILGALGGELGKSSGHGELGGEGVRRVARGVKVEGRRSGTRSKVLYQ